MYNGEKVVPIKDLNNFESDPEEFAKSFCKDMGIVDPEFGGSEKSLLAKASAKYIERCKYILAHMCAMFDDGQLESVS